MKKNFGLLLIGLFFVSGLTAQKIKLSGVKGDFSPCTTPLGDGFMKAVDTAAGRQVADNYRTWENGDVILVKFMNNAGSKDIRNRIMQFAKEWEQYGNITFKFVPDNTPQTNIRVRLGGRKDSMGHNSSVGIQCNDVPQYLQTLNLDTSDFIDYEGYEKELNTGGPFYQYLVRKGVDFNNYTYGELYDDIRSYPDPARKWNLKAMGRTSRHEFGHSLGLLHEQSYPGGIKWNTDTVYKYYASRGWNKAKVDFNVLEVSDQFFTNGTTYDPRSVMHYAVYAWQTLDGFSVERSSEISEGDKKIIGALYPKTAKVSAIAVPKVQISNLSGLVVKTDNVRKGLLIYPSFDLTTSAVLGKVHFVARLTTEDGKRYIPTANVRYSWNKMAGVYLPVNLLPSSKVTYNKGLKKNLELFFPFREMPDLQGKKVKVEFTVYLDDVVNNKLNRLVAYSLSQPLSMPL
ncbi:MAG: M12 family metallopeptidase [Bacteroidetes bacterium]|nr:M12 family metallopeptidase [Bacteroidota bacterium]